MPRIRSIKPEAFLSERLFDAEAASGGLPIRWSYAGMWTQADREGRFPWRPRTLKAAILPHDAVDFAAVLEVLRAHGFVIRYEADGESWGVIPSFKKHQLPNHREAKSRIPAPPENAADPVPSHAEDKPKPALSQARPGTPGKDTGGSGPGSGPGSVPSEQLSSRDETTGGDSPDSPADADLPPLALAWNAAVEHAGLPRVTRLSAARRRHVVARLKDEPDLSVWSRAFALIAADPFCRGTNDRGWRANFDYALRPEKCGRWLDLARAGPTEATPTADDEPWAVRTQRERLARLRQHVAAGTALTPRDAATLAELEAWERAHPAPRSAAGGSR